MIKVSTHYRIFILASILLSLIAFSGKIVSAESIEEGEGLVKAKCMACHSIGQGRRMGSDLKAVTTRYEKAWLKKMISAPDKLLAAKDPIATKLLKEYNNIPMPNLGLTDSQVDSIIAYLETTSGNEASSEESHEALKAELQEKLEGNALIGEKLFNGSKRFKRKGASCISCHSIGGTSFLGGGTLGTDLSKTFEKYGEEGTVSMLGSLSFPSMKAIYESKSLTDREIAHLREYFKLANQEAKSSSLLFFGLGLGLFLALLFLAQIVWKDRLTGVRRKLVEDAKKKGRK